jgi:hypothetical protein
MHHATTKFVPRILSIEHQEQHAAICRKLPKAPSDYPTSYSGTSMMIKAGFTVMIQGNNIPS